MAEANDLEELLGGDGMYCEPCSRWPALPAAIVARRVLSIAYADEYEDGDGAEEYNE